jgi:phosphoenolpyruvate carboxykinase (ATP)
MLRAALDGKLDGGPFRTDPVFGLEVPTACPEIPSSMLDPRGTWPKAESYDAQALRLAGLFRKNFEQFGSVADSIRGAGPLVA